MKRCPQCSSVYEDDISFCLNDGKPLIEENFSLPSTDSDYEAETIIRHDPIVVNIPGENQPPHIYQTSPVETVIIEKPARRRNPLVFLLLGLLLGGFLVLATLFAARSFLLKDNADTANINQTAETNANKAVKASPTETPLDISEMSKKHETRTSADDDEFNGRVIAVNAYVRASPSRGSDEVGVLPVDDRINIEKRENENSPWYYVTCEHGTSGWMHGNTIEFMQ